MATPNYAPHQVCPLCADDDNVVVVPMGPSLWRFTCDSPSHAAYGWETNTAGTKFDGLGGKSEELGLYDDLPRCLEKGEVWVEYGVVEWRYAHRNPKVYAQLIADYGHRSVDPKPYTASSFIASALGRLVDHGLIALQIGTRDRLLEVQRDHLLLGAAAGPRGGADDQLGGVRVEDRSGTVVLAGLTQDLRHHD